MTREEAPPLEAYRFHERDWENYDQLCESFEWEVPERFNVARYDCDRWADDRGCVALFSADGADGRETVTYWQLRNSADALANLLAERGVGRGDRVGVNLPQKPATAIAHVAVWKLGAVSVLSVRCSGPRGCGTGWPTPARPPASWTGRTSSRSASSPTTCPT